MTLLQRGPYKYWQAFGSDGMAGLYDFVKRAPGQREIRSTYGSFGAPNAQPSYDQYSSSWYRQPDVQRYSQPRTSYSRGYYNRAPYSNGYYESTAPSSNSYSAPRQSNKKKTYQYWQGFGSDGLAGLYDFVRKWANQPFWWQQSSVPSLLPSVFASKWNISMSGSNFSFYRHAVFEWNISIGIKCKPLYLYHSSPSVSIQKWLILESIWYTSCQVYLEKMHPKLNPGKIGNRFLGDNQGKVLCVIMWGELL